LKQQYDQGGGGVDKTDMLGAQWNKTKPMSNDEFPIVLRFNITGTWYVSVALHLSNEIILRVRAFYLGISACG